MKHPFFVGATIAGSVALFTIPGSLAQRSIPVRIDRWLSIQQVSGNVTYQRRSLNRPAKVGDRLEAVGDGLTTGARGSASLLVDTGVGTINVLEKTKLSVQALDVAPDYGRITRLQVSQGQVRLKLRRFTNRGSRLEIQTPAGLSGVRGTEFGVLVQPDGKTGLATVTGAVVSEAQGRNVSVLAGFQNFTIPGEPPSIPVPLRNDTRLRYELQQEIDRGVRKIRLIGQVDPVNSVTVDGKPQATDRNGRFDALFLAPSFLRIQVVVTTPLGKTESYDLALR
ncbi:FecR family protein [Phormidesmis priestleyi]